MYYLAVCIKMAVGSACLHDWPGPGAPPPAGRQPAPRHSGAGTVVCLERGRAPAVVTMAWSAPGSLG